MILYFCEGRNIKTEEAVPRLAEDYIKEKDLTRLLFSGSPKIKEGSSQDFQMERNENGKPYFVNIPIHFSVSHSNDLWVCVFSTSNVAVDIQEKRKVKAETISNRFFTKEEAHYVELFGEDGFFDIWARKEAYVKYKGTGFSKEGFDTFSVLDKNGDLAEKIGCLHVINVDMGHDIVCAVICEEKKALCYKEVFL